MSLPRKILAAVDFSVHSDRALGVAIELARRFSGSVHLFHALEVPLPIFEPYAVSLPAAFVEEARKAAKTKLEAGLARVREAGVEGTVTLGEVPAAGAIADRARELRAELVVVGTRGHTGLKHLLLGSVAERTVREAPCSVLTVKAEDDAGLEYRRIAVGVDFSDPAAQALDAALELAAEFGAELHLVHALDLRIPFVTPYEVSVPDAFIESARDAALQKLEACVAKARGRGVQAHSHLASAPPASALCEAAEQIRADLVVTGSRGLTGLKHAVLGSVAERTLRHARCSVLTVRGDDG